MEENLEGNLGANQLSECVDNGILRMPIHLVGDNDGCFKCVAHDNPKMSTEPTLTIRVCPCICLVRQQGHDCISPYKKGKT
eukprot:1383424-Prorocentrum_lima.AAC.1